MYKAGEYVSYGTIGVCKVEGFTQMEIDRSQKMREYYILRPVFEQRRTIYCPVDNQKISIRRNITEEEGYQLLQKLPDMEIFTYDNKKSFDDKCKNAVMSGNCEEWMKLIKSLLYDRRVRMKQGRKITSTSERYLTDAQNKLYGELSIAMNKNKSQIEEMMDVILRNLE